MKNCACTVLCQPGCSRHNSFAFGACGFRSALKTKFQKKSKLKSSVIRLKHSFLRTPTLHSRKMKASPDFRSKASIFCLNLFPGGFLRTATLAKRLGDSSHVDQRYWWIRNISLTLQETDLAAAKPICLPFTSARIWRIESRSLSVAV